MYLDQEPIHLIQVVLLQKFKQQVAQLVLQQTRALQLRMTVPAGMVGAHILFDWNTTDNIDVVNVWDIDGVWDQHGDTDPKNKLYDGPAGDAPIHNNLETGVY